MANFVESDLVERDELYFELEWLRGEVEVELIQSGYGWLVRTSGSHELAYLRKSDGRTPEQIASVSRIFEEFEDDLYGRLDQMIASVKSAKPEIPAKR